MNRWIVATASALLGLAFCLAAVSLANALHIGAGLPAPRGESDFELRASAFLFFVCPSFAVLGFAIGRASSASIRQLALRWLGVTVGTAVCFAALAGVISADVSSVPPNAIVVVFLVSWVMLAMIGGLVAVRRPAT